MFAALSLLDNRREPKNEKPFPKYSWLPTTTPSNLDSYVNKKQAHQQIYHSSALWNEAESNWRLNRLSANSCDGDHGLLFSQTERGRPFLPYHPLFRLRQVRQAQSSQY